MNNTLAVSSVDTEFSFLDQENFRQLYRDPAAAFDYQLHVDGLHCSSCVHRLENIPKIDPSIVDARVDFARSRLAVKTNPDFSPARLAALLKKWGYSSQFLNPLESNTQSQIAENRDYLKRIAVAGACTGNIMIFVIPVYAGLMNQWQTIFNWLSFFLFLPVLFYSAQIFYKGAWAGLRARAITIDLPITVALWSGFLLSTVNLANGRGEIYYDSTASFLFLILSARYLLKRVQQNFLSPVSAKLFTQDTHWSKKTGEGWSFAGLEEIGKGDVLRIEPQQSLPVDAALIDSTGLFDLSILNGESMPRNFHAGLEIMAGSKNMGPPVQVSALTDYRSSRIGRWLRELEENSLKKSPVVQTTDRLAQYLIIAVFSIAAIFFAGYAFIDLHEAFNRSLALIVLACPCALALGAPLTQGLAIRKALQRGIVIKDGGTLEKLLKVKNIFFDKTGTLSEGKLQLLRTEPSSLDAATRQLLRTEPSSLDAATRQLLLSLEQKSYHPLAFALRAQWPDTTVLPVESWRELPSRGVSGIINGKNYELTTSETPGGNSLSLRLTENSRPLCELYFEDPLRPDSKHCVEQLQRRFYNCFLLSGDREQRTRLAAADCGISPENTFFSLLPEDKRNIVTQHANSCMIGDGANDSLSLQAAAVGIAVKGSAGLSLNAADVHFLKGGLTPLIELLDIAARSRRVLVRNLSLSLVYNLIGASLALAGYVSPLLAAVLMPLSSALIILTTLWGLR